MYVYLCVCEYIYRAGFKKRKVIRHILIVASQLRHILAK